MNKNIKRNEDTEQDEVFKEYYGSGSPIIDNPVDVADQIFQLEENKPTGKAEYKEWKKKYNELAKTYNEMAGRKIFKIL